MSRSVDQSGNRSRAPHAILDRASRLQKAEKIVRILGRDTFDGASTLLEIGCGSGVIASSLSEAGSGRLQVFAVDTVDNRVERQGFEFVEVADTQLPFSDDSFDIVISNHVIEHVGPAPAQVGHLSEIFRVLKPGGVLYFAMPNRWQLVEPHFRIPFLSWLPQWLADIIVRASGKGTHYDCRPLSYVSARRLFRTVGFLPQNNTIVALRITLDIEYPRSSWARFTSSRVPSLLIGFLTPIIPTFVFTATKQNR